MPYVPNSTWVDGSGGGTPLSAARLNNMEAGISPTYIAYTPTWTASGAAPAIGNAVVVARYVQIGKFVHAHGQITFGNTSTFGTGTYTFALPVTAATASVLAAGTADLFDNSTSNRALTICNVAAVATKMEILYQGTLLNPASLVAQTAPWTWAVSDIIAWNILYEAA